MNSMPATHVIEADAAGNFRAVVREDIACLRSVIEATGLFPADMLDDMLAPYFDGAVSDDLWLTNARGEPCLVGYCVPERMTEGSWNILLMAVCPTVQGEGHGGLLLRAIEDILRKRQARIVLVETSGLEAFARVRKFYRECGYEEEARIREFYTAGEDKIIFRKALGAPLLARPSGKK